eukprot:IDg6171t1
MPDAAMTVAEMAPPMCGGVRAPPVAPPTLTIKQIRDAVPKHCFERSLARSVAHLLLDLVMITALGMTMWWLEARSGAPRALVLVIWPLYWWCQGAVMTGVWVLAHECGHQSFSPWKSVNDA